MEGVAFLVPSPASHDDALTARNLSQLCDDVDDLLYLHLVVDVSDQPGQNGQQGPIDMVKEAWEEHSRHVRFMMITKLAETMFSNSEKRAVN
jgi:hypothetical protein